MLYDLCLPGRSLLPVLKYEPSPGSGWDEVFASQNLHEVTMYYPMRAVRTRQYRLIHNMAYRMPFPIDQDFYASPTFQDILSRTHYNKSLDWFTTLHNYYYRAPFELYDVTQDQNELNNLANDQRFAGILKSLAKRLLTWQNATSDPWICAQDSVIVSTPGMADHCGPLYNEL
jgi:N-sulfoglucosamine sulfohydrolase